MSFIYNVKGNPQNPVFYNGMSCAAVAGSNGNLPFTRADLSELENVSNFFQNRASMTETPIIDLNGKIGLDTVFSGCNNLIAIYCYPRLESSFTLYSAAVLDFKQLACNLLNETIKHNPEEAQVITCSNNPLKINLSGAAVKLINGKYVQGETGVDPSFSTVLNTLNWSIA